MTIRVGIIGYGGFGRFLHRAWSGIYGVNVTAVADLALETTSSGVEGAPGVRTYASWKTLLDAGVVDLVSIATPPSSHPEIAIAALKQDVHVLVEKPVATTMAHARAILEARNESSAIATVNFMLRFNPIIAAVHGWCRSGVFGSLQRVVLENYAQDETLGPDHWFWDNTVSGGILVEHGVHFFDIVNGCTSSGVSRVTHRSWPRSHNPEFADRVFALVEYDDGLIATHYHAFNRLDEFERTSIRFVFDAAQIDVEGWIPMRGQVVALANPDSRSALNDLPNLKPVDVRPLRATRSSPLASTLGSRAHVNTMVSANFALDGTKEDAYLAALRALMTDVIEAVRNPNHGMRVCLEDGILALNLAQAGETAKRKDP